MTPEASASILSSVMFNWMNPFLAQLREAPTVYAEDLWALTRHHRAKECHRDFESIEGGDGPFSLLRQIYQSNRHAIWLQCITSLGAVLSHYSNPFFLDKFLQYIQDPAGRPLQNAYLYCLGMFAGSVINTLFSSQTLLWGRRCNVRMTNMLNAEIYAKSLRRKDATGFAKTAEKEDGDTSEEVVSESTTGKITNLMSVDAERLAEMSSYIHVGFLRICVIYFWRVSLSGRLIGMHFNFTDILQLSFRNLDWCRVFVSDDGKCSLVWADSHDFLYSPASLYGKEIQSRSRKAHVSQR